MYVQLYEARQQSFNIITDIDQTLLKIIVSLLITHNQERHIQTWTITWERAESTQHEQLRGNNKIAVCKYS